MATFPPRVIEGMQHMAQRADATGDEYYGDKVIIFNLPSPIGNSWTGISTLSPDGEALTKIAYAYQRDVAKIHKTLFGDASRVEKPQAIIGRFRSEFGGRVHADGHEYTSKPFYLARVLGLSFLYITGEEARSASADIKRIICTAAVSANSEPALMRKAEKARCALVARQILKPAALGAVMVLATLNAEVEGSPNQHCDRSRLNDPASSGGTLHCSSKVPSGGGLSGWFQATSAETKLKLG